MSYVRAFAAGFVSTLVFHQSVIGLFWLAGAIPRAPWSMQPTPPLGVPAVVSLAFWGGLWGAAIWPFLRDAAGSAYWWRAILIGAAAPTAVAMLIVFPMKGLPVDAATVIGGLIVNAVWGFGVALLMRLSARPGG